MVWPFFLSVWNNTTSIVDVCIGLTPVMYYALCFNMNTKDMIFSSEKKSKDN